MGSPKLQAQLTSIVIVKLAEYTLHHRYSSLLGQDDGRSRMII